MKVSTLPGEDAVLFNLASNCCRNGAASDLSISLEFVLMLCGLKTKENFFPTQHEINTDHSWK